MNKELLKKVRDRIADESVHYDQSRYWIDGLPGNFAAQCDAMETIIQDGKFCGTPCCVAGHAVAVAGVEKSLSLQKHSIQDVAQELLELKNSEAVRMFAPAPIRYGLGYFCPTRAEVLFMLDYAIETGKVNWRS